MRVVLAVRRWGLFGSALVPGSVCSIERLHDRNKDEEGEQTKDFRWGELFIYIEIRIVERV